MSTTSRLKLDLLASRPIRAVVSSAAFPVIFQVLALAAVVLLILNGIGQGLGLEARELLTFRKTNLTTLVVWGLWWPGMIALALTFGRAWCTVCPMELVNRVGEAVARKVGWPRARLGKLLRAGWMVLLAYLTLQILVSGVSIHRVPHYTAILLLVLLGGALVTGLVFRRRRSFCHAFCPAGALLSVYGRHTPFQLEAREASVCDDCSTKDCISKENRDRFDGRSCPSSLRPFDRSPSDGCVLCLQCVKACPRDNMGLGLVTDDAPIRRKQLLAPHEAVFVMIALGFVAHEVIGEVRWLDTYFHFVPERLSALVPALSFGWFEALWFLLLFPVLVWGAIAGAGYLAGHRDGLRTLLLAAATGAAPVVAMAHLAKAAAKISSWSGYVPYALRDPQGLETFRRLADQSLVAPTPAVGLSIVGWVMLAMMVVIAWRTFRRLSKAPAMSLAAARVGLAGAALLFGSVLTLWALPVR